MSSVLFHLCTRNMVVYVHKNIPCLHIGRTLKRSEYTFDLPTHKTQTMYIHVRWNSQITVLFSLINLQKRTCDCYFSVKLIHRFQLIRKQYRPFFLLHCVLNRSDQAWKENVHAFNEIIIIQNETSHCDC